MVATAIALLVERIAYRPLRNAPRLVPLISAIGASFFLQYSFRGFFGPGIYAYPTIPFLEEQGPDPAPQHRSWVDVLVIGAALAMMAGLYLFVHAVEDGHRHPRRVGGQGHGRPDGHRREPRHRADVRRSARRMAGAAGVLYGLLFQPGHLHDRASSPGIKAFTAAVLGGIGNIPGAMLGGLFLGQIESIGPTLFLDGLGVPAANQLKDVIAFTMLVLVLVFRPSGILGERVTRDRA